MRCEMSNNFFILIIALLSVLSLSLFVLIISLRKALSDITTGMNRVNNGDFTKKLSLKKGTCAQLICTFNFLLQNMRKFISNMNSSSDKISCSN